MYLTSTTPSNNISVSDSTFYNHDGIVQTPLHFSDELLSSSS